MEGKISWRLKKAILSEELQYCWGSGITPTYIGTNQFGI